MKKNLTAWGLAGFSLVSLTGTLLHFLYEWIPSFITALISGVNESTFEHMKLIFFPLFLFAAIEYFYIGNSYKNFWRIKLKGILLGLILIPTIFYTLKGIFGGTADWVNILIFFVSAAAVFVYEGKRLNNQKPTYKNCNWALIIICGIALLFFIFTFFPPLLPLFRDPISGNYGLQK